MFKKLQLIAVALFFAVVGVQAQQIVVLTVQGDVHFKNTGLPAAGQIVEAFVPSPISSIQFYGNAKTDEKGHFSFLLKAPEGTTEIQVATKTNCSDPTGNGIETQPAKVSADATTYSSFWICDAPPPPTCFAKAGVTPGSGKTMHFFSDAVGAAAGEKFEFLWNFGDGTTSTEQNPTHEYAAPGNYKVQLTAKTATCFAIADLLAEVVDLSNFQEITVSGFVHCANDGSPAVKNYVWINTPTASGGIGTFTDDKGFYQAKVLVPVGSTEISVQIFSQWGLPMVEIAKITATGTATANFKTDCAPAPPPLDCEVKIYAKDLGKNTFQFFAENFPAPTDPAVKISYFWEFGDGTGSTEPSPTHTFLKDGVYTVWLKTLNDKNCVATASLSIKTFSNGGGGDPTTDCQALFFADAQLLPDGTPSTTFIFKDASIGKTVKWQWFFGDGTTSNEQHPTHTFVKNGSYTVTLKTTADNGCESKIALEIYAGNKLGNEWDCQAMFLPLPDAANKLGFQFVDMSTTKADVITAWNWKFGDGTASAEQNPFHIFPAAGIYKISLEIKGSLCNSLFFMELDTENPKLAPDGKTSELGLSAQSSGAGEVGQLFEKLQIFPNPTDGELNFVFENLTDCDLEISILDLSGKILQTKNRTLPAGKTQFFENVAELPAGVYFARLKTLAGLQVLKFFKS